MSEPWSFPRPWAIADHDGRISIVAADGQRVTEVYPSQHLGVAPSVDVCRRVAAEIAADHNFSTIEHFLAAPITPAMVRAWKRAFELKGPTFAETASDEEQAAADFHAMLNAMREG